MEKKAPSFLEETDVFKKMKFLIVHLVCLAPQGVKLSCQVSRTDSKNHLFGHLAGQMKEDNRGHFISIKVRSINVILSIPFF